MEQWKIINNNFEISSYGRIRSRERYVFTYPNNIRHIPSKIMRLWEHSNGYLSYNVRGKNELVHRLVAEYFIPNPNNLLEVNHKDNNRHNNNVDNLEWITHKNNAIHAVSYRSDVKPVAQFDINGNLIKIWPSLSSTHNASNIQKCCIGKRKTCNGYIWRYWLNNLS